MFDLYRHAVSDSFVTFKGSSFFTTWPSIVISTLVYGIVLTYLAYLVTLLRSKDGPEYKQTSQSLYDRYKSDAYDLGDIGIAILTSR